MADNKGKGAAAKGPKGNNAAAAASSPAPQKPAAGKKRPDEAQYEKDKELIDKQIKQCSDKYNDLRSRVQNADGGGGGAVGSKRRELLDERSKVSGELRSLKEEKERLLRMFEDLKKVRDVKVKEAEEIRDRTPTPYKTQEKIDQAIDDLENKIRSGNLKLIEEKKFVTEINNLKKAKKNMEVYDKRMEEQDGEKKKFDEIKAKLDAKSEEQKSVFEKLKKIEGELDQLKKGQDDDRAQLNNLIEQRNKKKEELDSLYEKKRQLYATFKQQRDDFRAHQLEETLKKKEAQKVLREQMLDEKKKALEAQRREERMIPKFVEEITTATNLIFFLDSNYVIKASSSAPEAKKALDLGEGVVPLKSKADRNADDAYFVGKGTKKDRAPAKPSKPAIKKTDTIRLPLGMLEQFSQLGVAIPATPADVEKTIQELKEKKEHYETRQKEELAKALREEEEDKKREAEAEAGSSAAADKPQEEEAGEEQPQDKAEGEQDKAGEEENA